MDSHDNHSSDKPPCARFEAEMMDLALDQSQDSLFSGRAFSAALRLAEYWRARWRTSQA